MISEILILVDFGENFWKSRFCSIFTKNIHFVEIFRKSQFWLKFSKSNNISKSFRKIWIWVNTIENLDLG